MKKLGDILILIIRKNPFMVVLSCIAGSLTILFAASLYGLASYLISLTALRPTFEVVMIPVVGVRFFGIGRAAFRYLERLVSHDTTFRVLRDLRVYTYNRIEPRLPDFSPAARRGRFISGMVSDVENLQDVFLRIAYPSMIASLILLTGFICFYPFNPAYSWIFFIVFLTASVITPQLLGVFSKGALTAVADIKQRMYNEFIEFTYGLVEIVINLRQQSWEKRFDTILREEFNTGRRIALQGALSSAASAFFPGISLFACLMVSCLLVSNRGLSPVLLAVVPLAASALFEATFPLFSIPARIEKASSSAERLFGITGDSSMLRNETMAYKAEHAAKYAAGSAMGDAAGSAQGSAQGSIKGSAERSTEGNVVRNAKGSAVHVDGCTAKNAAQGEMEDTAEHEIPSARELRVSALGFGFSGARKIIDDFSLSIRQGEITALIGASGSGKSTLVNLILGFIGGYEGAIEIDSVNTKTMDHEKLLRYFSVTDQKPFFFNASIRENLRIANIEATEQEMMNALKRANAFDFVADTVNGLDTLVSEMGLNLSGGELQRLSIARTLLKDAPFYIFDEPTASLDTLNAKHIMDLIKELSKTRGVLLITHRREMLAIADQVVSLQG